jgi:protein FAM50
MGDFAAGFHRPTNTGIYTVEGNVAGSRAAALTQQRIKDQQLYEEKREQLLSKQGIADDNNDNKNGNGNAVNSLVGKKFAEAALTTAQENQLRDATIGLVTADQFRKLQKEALDGTMNLQNKRTAEQILLDEKEKVATEKAVKKAKLQRMKEKKKLMATLSFAGTDEQDDDIVINGNTNKKLIQKDPTVDTSFLPDRERDASVAAERERIQKEWEIQQEVKRKSSLEIVYSYWDGSGHRRSATVQQGSTIGEFLEVVRKQLASEFRELANVASDALIYIKEDLILNHDLTFYDLIATKARGKSGPLFHFDVHEDIRIGQNDVRIEKDESHPGKIVQRYWYERNKHIFPASRWEVYDPARDYGSYTIGGKTVN